MRTSTAPTTLAVIGLLSGAFLAAACGSDSDTGATSDTGTPQESAPDTLETAVDTAAAGFPLEIENCGRTLTFEAPPERVVTGYHPSFELMAELGLGDRLIGRTPYDEEGPDGAGVLPEHKDLYDSVPQISDSISFPAAEEMLALGADFVLSEGYYNFDAADGAATIDELEASGANVYITGGWCSADDQLDFKVDTVLQDIRNLGMIFGEAEAGEALATELEGMLDEVATATADEDGPTVVLLDASPDALFAMGQGMGTQLIELAGGVNAFADGDTYGEYSAEEIAASGAEGIGVISYLPTTDDERIAVIEEVAAATPAAQQDAYVVIPASGTHPGYRAFLTIRDLAEAFHPDAFAE